MNIEVSKLRLVVVESPLSGDFERNVLYAKFCMLDCFQRNEAPFASHLLYTQVLDDRIESHRFAGMHAGFKWAEQADLRVFYVDLGMSQGMIDGIIAAQAVGQETRIRKLDKQLFDAFERDAEIMATPGLETKKNG